MRNSWQEAWESAVELAVEELRRMPPEELCARSGALWDPGEGAIELSFLDRSYLIRPPDFGVFETGEEEAQAREKILILHYLQTASGAPLAGKWIAFSEVPGGERYLGNFRARSIDRMVRDFAGKEPALVEAAGAIGGCRAGHGDFSLTLCPLPRVPVELVFWKGDDEFPPSGNFLFDASAPEYLPTEDMVVLAETTVTWLKRMAEGSRS